MKGLLVIISAPSGGGKDAVIHGLLKKIPNSSRLVTTTTRTPRPDDREGVNYFFITPELFKQKISNGEFVEYNLYAGNYYGTERKVLDESLSNNEAVFSSIEVNGKHNLDRLNIRNLAIFLNPESLDVLRNRIQKRGGTTPESLEERLKLAEKEIKDSVDYDYHLENREGSLTETVKKIEEIVEKELEERKTLDKSTGLR